MSVQANVENDGASPQAWRSHSVEEQVAFGTPVFAAAAAAASGRVRLRNCCLVIYSKTQCTFVSSLSVLSTSSARFHVARTCVQAGTDDAIAGLTPLAAGDSQAATPETEASGCTPLTQPSAHPIAVQAADDAEASPLTSAVRYHFQGSFLFSARMCTGAG